MADLLHIFITPKAGVTTEQIEQKLGLALDWFRYADGCYFLYTSKSLATWNTRLSEFVRPGGYVLIVDVDLHDYKGYMPKTLWPWLEDKKKKLYGDSE